MLLILTKNDYLGMNPVYGFELPNYLSKILNMSEDDYFQAAMQQTQRIINAYMQDFLLLNKWSIENLDETLQEQIKQILFLEFEYLHQNQMFFKKSEDITYSNSGQQTFTFNANLSESDNPDLIPDYVVKIIKNTGILNFADSYSQIERESVLADNEFIDGVFVNEVAWSDKADNNISVGGENLTVSQAINNNFKNSVKIDNVEFVKSVNLNRILRDDNIRLNSNKLLSSNQFYQNKNPNDYAQITDLQNLWTGSNALIEQNSQDIQNNAAEIQNLKDNAIDNSTIQNYLGNKADKNFSNVQLAPRAKVQNIQVNYDGRLVFEQAVGNIAPRPWRDDVEYQPADTCWVEIDSVAKIFLATEKEKNINQNPLTSTGYWIPYTADFDLSGYLSEENANNWFLKLSGGNMNGNIDMQGNQLINASNVLETDSIADNQVSSTTLWSSEKTDSEIKTKTLLLNSENVQNLIGAVNFEKTPHFHNGLGIYNGAYGGTIKADENGNINIDLVSKNGNLLVNGELIKTDLTDYYTKEEVDALIAAGESSGEIVNLTMKLKEGGPTLNISAFSYTELNNWEFNSGWTNWETYSNYIANGYIPVDVRADIPTSGNKSIFMEDNTLIFGKDKNLKLYFRFFNATNSSVSLSVRAMTFDVRLLKVYGVGGAGGGTDYVAGKNIIIENNEISVDDSILNLQSVDTNILTASSASMQELTITNQATSQNEILIGAPENDKVIPNAKSVYDFTYSQAIIDQKIASIPTAELQAGNNIQIEHSTVISTTDDLIVDSINLNGKDLSNELNSINTSIETSNINIAGVSVRLSTLENYLKDGNLIRFRGAYSPTVNYAPYDYVIWTDNLTYYALKASIGIEPTNAEYWKKQEISQSVDLTNYYTKAEVDSKLGELRTTISNNTNEITSLKSRVSALESASLNNVLVAQIQTHDSAVRVTIKNLAGQTVNVSGQVAIRWHSGYMDVGALKKRDTVTLNLTNGAVTWNYSGVADYEQSYDWFNIGVKAIYNNKNYFGNLHCLSKAHGDYDYLGLTNNQNCLLLPV